MQLDPRVYEMCNNAVFITGVGRSGTTILGNIIHSLEGVEYLFEPPLLYSLFAQMKDMGADTFRILYETYLYEDFLIDALAGRRLNTNTEDDSSVFRVDDEKKIRERLTTLWSKIDLEKKASDAVIAYKLTDAISFVPKIRSYYPKTKIVVTSRKANDVFHSVKNKGWFTDATLRNENRIWPYTLVKGIGVPWFVAENDRQYFANVDELHRIAYYYLANTLPRSLKNICIINYSDLIQDPEKEVRRLSAFIGRTFGPKTDTLIRSIKERPYPESEDLVARLDPTIRKQVLKISPL